MTRRRTTAARWLVLLVLVVVLASLPTLVGRLQQRPAAGTGDVAAATVLARVQAARGTGWSGNAETRGGLVLPVTDVLSDLVDLVGSTTTVRAWWSGPLAWRVDQLSAVGELDTVRDAGGSWEWDYQKGKATRVGLDPAARVRLPTVTDLLPPTLGARLVAEALPSEVTRLPGQQIAGHDTLGIRLRPAQAQSSVDHVDLWADAASGVPLRVQVWAPGASNPAIAATFLDVTIGDPGVDAVTFTPPAGAEVDAREDPDGNDLLAAVDRYSRVRPPRTLAGLDANDGIDASGAVGIYGRGVTELIAVPLSERYAGGLRDQLTAAATVVDGYSTLGIGPLNLLVTPEINGSGHFWLLAGTVTPETLHTAADFLENYDGGGFR